ncbi:TIGR00270 family protein [Candidatus Woesearchaeota archaeon]|nr:TIGR00270 family protein [Candidatus Woesearchaeota archaeon]
MIKINCDLCGKVGDRLNKALIEEVELQVCLECSKFGRVIGPVKTEIPKAKVRQVENKVENFELVIENFADVIKRKREAMGLTQKDFAAAIREKESTIHKLEIGTLEPSLSLAKKLEKALGVKLIEEHQEKRDIFKGKKLEGFTLGDFIKLKE